MNNKLQAKLVAYNATREQIYSSLMITKSDLTNDFTFNLAICRSTRQLRKAVADMQDMVKTTSYIPTSQELAKAIKLGVLINPQ